MDRVEGAQVDGSLPVAVLRETFQAHPIRVAVLFGSVSRGETHERSDIDVAVEFDGIEPGDDEYADALFGLGADLAESLGTDDVDVVDLRRATPGLARALQRDGRLLVGDPDRVEALLDERSTAPQSTPRDRIDEALRRIDEHLA